MAWHVATVVAVRDETPVARTIVLDVPSWPGHLAGQHVDLRLTAEDGYSTQRGYSLAAPANGHRIELTVQRVEDGEVSPHLTRVVEVGDVFELRGPIGGWFVWRPEDTAPVLLLAGGSGIVPLMAMIRARRSPVPFRLLYSVRRPADRFYVDELRNPPPGVDVTYVYTRNPPEDWPRPPERLNATDLATAGWPADLTPDCFVCGPTGFVEAAADLLVGLGHDPSRIRTERFGTGGD
ncbi:ferredoxin reductase [Umezawaea sp. Da 62-37]|uniref:ferredoxin reductase n=1 Tax=Umezawaea sp. Da 62-37 TaxID=3075927 RepID=UPI0028F71F18|nr:ferredoxin reductase [Umezawaea sp. Da 62-37]WNV86323.1 ferredoxin reductase [Umezawaea sp. Da 62-37]